MKIFKIFALCFVSFITVACSKSESNIETNKPSEIFFKISQLKNEEFKTISLKSLNAIEKSAYWTEKMRLIQKNNKLDVQQVKHIDNLIDNLTVPIFKETNERAIFFNYYIEEWIKSAQNNFTNKQIYTILFSHDWDLSNQNVDLVFANETKLNQRDSETNLDNCHCTIDARYTCGRISGIISIEWGKCSMGAGTTCINKGERSCGTLFDQECNGNICTW